MNRSHSIHEDDQPWTTTRCNRLLRPISSRIAFLRKELENGKLRPAGTSAASSLRTKASGRNLCPSKGPRPRSSAKNADPDWIPNAKPGAAAGRKRTYGGRVTLSRMATQKQLDIAIPGRPGEVSVDTPIISRTLGPLQDTPLPQGSPTKQVKRGRKPIEREAFERQALKHHMAPEVWKQVNGLFDAYRNLLQATRPASNDDCGDNGAKGRGTRSLMSTCIRQVPTYIALEEYWLAVDGKDEENERDLVNEIYVELEDRGACGGHGWRPMKELVRAHGTALLCDAFEDKVLHMETLRQIYRVCIQNGAYDEAEKLLASFLVVLKPLSPPPNAKTDFLFDASFSSYMHMLKTLLDIRHNYAFFYDQIEYMISQDILPLEWLATPSMGHIWSRIFRTFSYGGNNQTYASAYRLLETVVSLGAGLPADSIFDDGEVQIVTKQAKISSRTDLREALNNTLSSLLTLLSGIALTCKTRDMDGDQETVRRVTWTLDSLLIGLIKRKDVRTDLELLDPTQDSREAFARRALWSVAASFLVHLGECSLEPYMIILDLPTLISSINWIISQYSSDEVDMSSVLESFPSFIAATAQCTGRVFKDDGFDQLKHFVDALISVKHLQLSLASWSFKRIALDSCFEFAQSTKSGEHFAYARKIEQMLTKAGRSMVVRSPEKSSESSGEPAGFRWEEGIGEWVAYTPARYKVHRPSRKMCRRTSPIVLINALPSPAESQKANSSITTTGPPQETTEELPESPESPASVASEDQAADSSPIISQGPAGSAGTQMRLTMKRSLEQTTMTTTRKTRRISVESDAAQSSDVSRDISPDESSSSSRSEVLRPRRTLRQSASNIADKERTLGNTAGLTLGDSADPVRRGRGRPPKAAKSSNQSTVNVQSSTSAHQKRPASTVYNSRRSGARALRPRAATDSSFSVDESDEEDELATSGNGRASVRAASRGVGRRTSNRSLRRQASTAHLAAAKRQASLVDLVDMSDDELSFG